MFWKNFMTMSVILSPAIILFGMIIFSGKPKDQLRQEEDRPGKTGVDDNR